MTAGTSWLDCEWIEIDFGGERLTHRPSGDTFLRHRYMRSAHESVWNDRVRELARRHPEADTIRNSRGVVVGSLADHAALGRDFSTGDVVLMLSREDRSPERALSIVAAEPTPGLPWKTYTLDDGATLYWNDDFNGWFAWDRSSETAPSRCRRPMAGETFDHLLVDDAAPGAHAA